VVADAERPVTPADVGPTGPGASRGGGGKSGGCVTTYGQAPAGLGGLLLLAPLALRRRTRRGGSDGL
jgi:hypothetical protein